MNEAVFGVYIHWPYCAHICPYCDFNVYRARSVDPEPLIEAIAVDLAGQAARFGARAADTVFIGGGTPSLLSGADVARLIEAVARAFPLAADCEITLEANPEDAARFVDHAAAGVNRFSVGVQALDDAALKALGRWHDAAAARAAVEAAARTGKRVSLDLIYGREGQGVEAWRGELRAALALPVEHVSLYQLTIEPDTAFARKVARGALAIPDAEAGAALFEATQSECGAAGFPAYEISNHARNDGARSRHNLVYWRGGDWVGVGPGAHGRFTTAGARIATEAQRHPKDYIDAVREHGVGWLTEARLTNSEAADELLLMGLRIVEGVDLARIERLRGAPINHAALDWLLAQHLVAKHNERIALTAAGRPLANRIISELLS